MKQLIIIGAGGMGRSMFNMAKNSVGYAEMFEIKGFIDDNLHALDNFANYPPVIGTINDYVPCVNDAFICSIGGKARINCTEQILNRGGEFISLISKYAIIAHNVTMGKGNIVGAYTAISSDTVIGDFNLIQNLAIIGHDVVIGNWNRIDTHVTLVGGVKVGNENEIYTSSVLNHGVVVEDRAHVGACSFVIKRVKSDTTVFGVPAKRL